MQVYILQEVSFQILLNNLDEIGGGILLNKKNIYIVLVII